MPKGTTKTERPVAGLRSTPSLARTIQAMQRLRGRQALARPERGIVLSRVRQAL